MLSVWIKLFISHNDPNPTTFEIYEESIRNTDALKSMIKEKMKPRLDHAAAPDLDVFEQGTQVHTKLRKDQALSLSTKPPDDTNENNPLIVVAPSATPPLQTQDYQGDGEKHWPGFSANRYTTGDDPHSEAQFRLSKRHKNDMNPLPLSMPETPPDHFNWDEKHPPPFLSRDGWLNGILNTIDAFLPYCEANKNERVPPLVISRCSRGGKTRALHEIALAVQNQTNNAVNPTCPVNVLFVSFNGNITPVKKGETPLYALTRRIAFALSDVKKDQHNFNKMFRPLQVTEEQVREWLKNRNWLLLIDELNKFDLLSKQVDLRDNNREFAEFLKEHFLVKEGRYFAFSTHEISTGYALCNFMESNSNRDAKVKPLPLIPSLAATMDAFGDEMHDKGKLSPRLAIYCGLVPGLIYLETCHTFPTLRRGEILETFLERHPTDEYMKIILGTLLEGDHRKLLDFPELLQLTDTTNTAEVRWIPNHLVFLLNNVAASPRRAKLSDSMRGHLRTICDLFGQFRDAKTQSGEGWEALFVVLVLIRAVTRKSDHLLSLSEYIQSNPQTDYCVEFNSPIKMANNKTLGDINELDKLLECIDQATVNRATIGIYFPTINAFKKYDAIVVKWNQNGAVLQRIGYQLKEGGEIPKTDASCQCDQSFVIRGRSAKTQNLLRGWNVASTEQLDAFFGTSGAEWTPEKWRLLKTGC